MSDQTVLSNEELATRLTRWERNSTIKNWVIIVLGIGLCIAISGWWFTSRDQTATERNGERADCRGLELAADLDEFKIIVSSTKTEQEKEKAAQHLDELGSLVRRYDKCLEANE